jgi:uncharacterized membrane protein YhaH (DUF805 family)
MSMEEIVNVEFEQPPQTGFVEAIKKGFKGYVVWNARSTRSEYWWWTLFAIIVAIVASIVDSLFFSTDAIGTGPIGALTSLALFLPGLSVLVRRLHDTDRTGWWFWIILIPIIGLIVLLIFMLLPSRMGPTRWNNRVAA